MAPRSYLNTGIATHFAAIAVPRRAVFKSQFAVRVTGLTGYVRALASAPGTGTIFKVGRGERLTAGGLEWWLSVILSSERW